MDESYRNELARQVLLTMLGNTTWVRDVPARSGKDDEPERIAREAVAFADALISELNREEPAE